MIDRRSLIAISAAMPFTRLLPRLDVPDLRLDPLEVADGVEILSISPDASTLVGLNGRKSLAFYATDTLEEISATAETPEIGAMDRTSIQWNPDGTKIAFSIDSFLLMRDSDIFVVDVDTAEVMNLTGEGTPEEAGDLFNAENVQLDMHPQWLDNETLLFVRTTWNAAESSDSRLVTMGLNDNEVADWAVLDDPDIRFVLGPTRMVEDGRVIFVADVPDNTTMLYAVAEGEAPKRIESNISPFVKLNDANESYVLITDWETEEAVRISYNDPSTAEPVLEMFDLEFGIRAAGMPAFGPTPDSIVLPVSNANRSVMVLADGDIREVAYLRGEEGAISRVQYVEQRILIAARPASWLVDLEE